MRILLANDHGAVELKRRIEAHLKSKGHETVNLGVDTEASVDYPDIGVMAAKEFLSGGYDLGVVCCGTGIGISIAANKIKGIRCAVVHDLFTTEMAKAHNNANFLAFGGRVKYQVSVEAMLDKFLETKFEGGRHGRRVDKLDALC
jgi:ribose 5-phosphate isomerase B